MARICESSLRLLSEQIKTKYIHIKENKVVLNEDVKQCNYCPKTFLNGFFVIKHMLKRHTDQFYKSPSKTESSLGPGPHLIKYENEISTLKSEFKILKKEVTDLTVFADELKNTVKSDNCAESKPVASVPEEFVNLQRKIEKMSIIHTEDLLSLKREISLLEEKICERLLKKELLPELKNILTPYVEQNSKLKQNLVELTGYIKQLEQSVANNTERLHSLVAFKEVKDKIETQIQKIYEDYKIPEEEKTNIESSRKSSPSMHRINRRKKKLLTRKTFKTTESPTDYSETDTVHLRSIFKKDCRYSEKLAENKRTKKHVSFADSIQIESGEPMGSFCEVDNMRMPSMLVEKNNSLTDCSGHSLDLCRDFKDIHQFEELIPEWENNPAAGDCSNEYEG